jgi:hypothetical protein
MPKSNPNDGKQMFEGKECHLICFPVTVATQRDDVSLNVLATVSSRKDAMLGNCAAVTTDFTALTAPASQVDGTLMSLRQQRQHSLGRPQ